MRMSNENAYRQLVQSVLTNGIRRPSRVGGGTVQLTGYQLGLDMIAGFPLLTGRRIHYRGVLGELAAFLEGAQRLSRFEELGCNYWRHNAAGREDLGPIYGAQWRGVNDASCTHDQLMYLVTEANNNWSSRRLFVSAWNPIDLSKMCLPPCHTNFQVIISGSHGIPGTPEFLDMVVTMRSVDVMLGLPSDIVMYGALMHILANDIEHDLTPRRLVFQLGDTHIYNEHIIGAQEYLGSPRFSGPRALYQNPDPRTLGINNFMPGHFKINEYYYSREIKFELF